MRMIVPLTPKVCFVTLPGRETEKRIVPAWLNADESLAKRISAALIGSAAKEFLSHPDFVPAADLPDAELGDLLFEIEAALDRKEALDEAQSA
jgi:hypothetical protein